MLSVPVYNQLSDLLPDGNPDPFASTDCGSECVAMICDAYGYGGVPGFTAGEVRVIIRRGDRNGTGLTTATDLVYGLSAIAQLPSHVRNVNLAVAKIEISRAIFAKMPCIVLGTWDGNELHWVVVVDTDTKLGLMVNDPWGGEKKTISWDVVAANYAGTYVHLDRALP